MNAWFALTQGRLRSVLDYTDAGINAASHASVVVQLTNLVRLRLGPSSLWEPQMALRLPGRKLPQGLPVWGG